MTKYKITFDSKNEKQSFILHKEEYDKIYNMMFDTECDMNECDKCGLIENTNDLVWIDSEDFEPLHTDKFNKNKFLMSIDVGYSALCDNCYTEECCDE